MKLYAISIMAQSKIEPNKGRLEVMVVADISEEYAVERMKNRFADRDDVHGWMPLRYVVVEIPRSTLEFVLELPAK